MSKQTVRITSMKNEWVNFLKDTKNRTDLLQLLACLDDALCGVYQENIIRSALRLFLQFRKQFTRSTPSARTTMKHTGRPAGEWDNGDGTFEKAIAPAIDRIKGTVGQFPALIRFYALVQKAINKRVSGSSVLGRWALFVLLLFALYIAMLRETKKYDTVPLYAELRGNKVFTIPLTTMEEEDESSAFDNCFSDANRRWRDSGVFELDDARKVWHEYLKDMVIRKCKEGGDVDMHDWEYTSNRCFDNEEEQALSRDSSERYERHNRSRDEHEQFPQRRYCSAYYIPQRFVNPFVKRPSNSLDRFAKSFPLQRDEICAEFWDSPNDC